VLKINDDVLVNKKLKTIKALKDIVAATNHTGKERRKRSNIYLEDK